MHQRELHEKARRKGYRLTIQRQTILDEIVHSMSHPRAEEIFRSVKKRMPSISFGTVYRNLRVFKELGLISELNFGRNFSRYDANTKNHQHFICTVCGSVYDIDKPVSVEIEKVHIKGIAVEISDYRLEFYGRCHKCASSPQ